MSIFHYIGANKELPLGERGSKKINREYGEDNEIEEYETMEDAAGIYIQDVHPIHSGIKKHFRAKYVYRISANIGSFQVNQRLKELNRELYKINKKCLIELFKFIEESINENEEIEIYTCMADEEKKLRNNKLDMTINLNSFEIGDNFELKDKQYIVLNKTY